MYLNDNSLNSIHSDTHSLAASLQLRVRVKSNGVERPNRAFGIRNRNLSTAVMTRPSLQSGKSERSIGARVYLGGRDVVSECVNGRVVE